MSILDHAGQGYITEAVNALIPALFKRMPPANAGGLGFDYIEAITDTENWPSRRVLEKCGFTYCGSNSQDFNNPSMGVRDSAVFRLPRPGKTFEGLGLSAAKRVSTDDENDRPVPPVQ